jgi:hypothetical protein
MIRVYSCFYLLVKLISEIQKLMKIKLWRCSEAEYFRKRTGLLESS